MLFSPRRKPRGFNYEPRYNSDGTKKEQKRPEFDFSRSKPGRAKSGRSLIFMLLLVALLVYLIMFFRQFDSSVNEHKFEVQSIEVEE